jgi:Kef-type K+ transport system membrane component KefB
MDKKRKIVYALRLLILAGAGAGLFLLIPHYQPGIALNYFRQATGNERLVLFFLLLFVVVPLLERFYISGIITLIAAGFVLGPHVLAVIPAHPEALKILADIGKIYILFLAGLEVDLKILRREAARTFVFGILTFSLPFAGGYLAGRMFGYGTVSAVLIGSLLASHTLLALPILQKRGLLKDQFAVVAIGGTVLTDILAMLVLAVCLFMHAGQFTASNLLEYVLHLILYCVVVIGGIFWAAESYFRRGKSEIQGAMFVMLALIVAGLGADLIGLEAIVGAFLCGLAINGAALNRRVAEKLHFVGNLLFIPMFFVYTGYSLDLPAFRSAIVENPGIVIAFIVALIGGKFLAAYIHGTCFRYRREQKLALWSLSLPQVAATLAASVVAYEAVNAQGQRLIDGTILNVVIVLVIVTCFLGPFLTDLYSRKIAQTSSAGSADDA